MNRPAARMIGVASRNANRTACSWSSPRSKPATMVMPERLMPASRARLWKTPMTPASRMPHALHDRRVILRIVLGVGRVARRLPPSALSAVRRDPRYRSATQPLTDVEQDAVEGQEDRGRLGLGENTAQRLFEGQAENSGRDRGDDQQPGQPLVHGLDTAVADRGDESADDPHPVAPEEAEQCQRGGDMQRDDEGEVRRAVRLLLGDQVAPLSRR